WDWLLCIPIEYRMIWRAKWSPIKLFYLFSRYWVLGTAPYLLWLYCRNHSLDFCKRVYTSPVILSTFNQASAEAILLIRTWAFFGRDRKHLALLSVMLLGVVTYQLYIASKRIRPMPFVGRDVGPCFPASIPGDVNILGYFIASFCFDALVTIATLVKVLDMRRRNGPTNRLITLFLGEGVFYFIFISVANLINGAFYFQQAIPAMCAMMIPLSIFLSPLLACRLVRLVSVLLTLADLPRRFLIFADAACTNPLWPTLQRATLPPSRFSLPAP
ncbi:hypothetical protein K488DRAFT_41523, partial [Vararia minispora EC-137]